MVPAGGGVGVGVGVGAGGASPYGATPSRTAAVEEELRGLESVKSVAAISRGALEDRLRQVRE